MDKNSEEVVLYEFLREEIAREDSVTHQRMTVALALQGFLFAAVALLVASIWPTEAADNGLTEIMLAAVVKFRLALIGGIGMVGLLVAIGTMLGIAASQISIYQTKRNWERYARSGNRRVIVRLPAAYGRGCLFHLGTAFAYWITASLILMWGLFVFAFVRSFPVTSWLP
jgi:hypothetical protein